MRTIVHSLKSRWFTRALAVAALGMPFAAIPEAAAQKSPESVADLMVDKPYKYVGLVTFYSGKVEYIGSGTVIKPSSILTAGHNLYARGSGWSKRVAFERSYYFGASESRSTASKMYILGGYASLVDRKRGESDAGFARDMGGVVFFSRPANGDHAKWKKSPKLLTGTSYNMSLGYGAVVHSGEELLRSAPTRPFFKVTNAYYENRSYGIEGGMSGGPVFARSDGKWVVCAVNVSGPAGRVFDRGAGVRAVDQDAATFINKKLR